MELHHCTQSVKLILREPLGAPRSTRDLHALPERHVIFDVGGRGLGLRIIPGGILVGLAVNDDVIVVRDAFPRTDSGVIAWTEAFLPDATGGEILVPFHLFGVTAFSQGSVVPGRFCHALKMRLEAEVSHEFSGQLRRGVDRRSEIRRAFRALTLG